jgi:Ser/Thr protein kinase RdoA (MazF antagonist)
LSAKFLFADYYFGSGIVTNSVLGARIAEGRTAEIFAWRDHRILKLYREWCPPHWIDYELKIARIVQSAKLPVPAVGEIVEVNARRGLIYERLDGGAMREMLLAQWWKISRFARMFAELHTAIHACTVADLPSQHEGFAHAIHSAPTLPDDWRSAALRALDDLPDGDQLCHGDFHPGNVLMTAHGPIVIDWMTAKRGNPIAEWIANGLRGQFSSSYLRRYGDLRALNHAQIAAWMPVIAAARLNENIAAERDQVLAMVRAGLG